MDNVNEYIEAKKLTVQQAMVLVWDRKKWKHQVAASSSLQNDGREQKKKKEEYKLKLNFFVSICKLRKTGE